MNAFFLTEAYLKKPSYSFFPSR